LAGPAQALAELEQRVREQEVACRRVQSSHAFHTSQLQVLQEPLRRVMETVSLQAPQIPYLSNLTGTWITAQQATDPAYWVEQMTHTARIVEGMSVLLAAEPDAGWLEVGPGQALSSLLKQHPSCGGEQAQRVCASLPTLGESGTEQEALLKALGKLWLAGVSPCWEGLYAGERRQRVALPTYPFERQHYWIDPPHVLPIEEKATPPITSIGKKADLGAWFYTPYWELATLPHKQKEEETLRSPLLVFLDEGGVGEQLAERLEKQGRVVIQVRGGTSYKRLGERAYVLPP